MNIEDLGNSVVTFDEFCLFLKHLEKDFIKNKSEWGNQNLEFFLNALQRYAEALPQFYKNNSEEVDLNNPSWTVIIDLILGARIYD